MRLSTTKFVLFMVFVVCFITTQAVAKHHHEDCDDDDHEDWDDNNDWDDGNDWDHDNGDNDWDNNNDWNNNDWDNNNSGSNNGDSNNGDSSNGDSNNSDSNNGASSTLSGSWPMPTYGQSTGYYPSGAPVTVTATYTQVFTATSIPSNYPNEPQLGSMASVKSMGVPVTLAAIMFTIVIVA